MKNWILVKNRGGEIDKLTSTPVKGKTVCDLTSIKSYKVWLAADKVWVNPSLTRMRFKVPGKAAYTLPLRGRR